MRCHEQGPCQSCLKDEDGDGIPDVVQGDIAANVTNMVGDMVNDMAGGGGGSGEKGGGGMGGVPTGLMQLAGGAGGIAVRYPWPFLSGPPTSFPTRNVPQRPRTHRGPLPPNQPIIHHFVAVTALIGNKDRRAKCNRHGVRGDRSRFRPTL